MNEELRRAIVDSARQIGIDPVDLATVISYETGGTFDPMQSGPTTKWGRHRGLIQWGEPQAQKYLGGDFSVPKQAEGIVAYMRDAGVKPGMGLMDVYSAVNAGGVGRYWASDEAAGGAPGTVADKVNNQMGGHRAKAQAFINAPLPPPDKEIGGDSMVARSYPGLQPASTFGSLAPSGPATASISAGSPLPTIDPLAAETAFGDKKIKPGDRLASFFEQIGEDNQVRAPGIGGFPGGPSPGQATALMNVLANPNMGDLLRQKRMFPFG